MTIQFLAKIAVSTFFALGVWLILPQKLTGIDAARAVGADAAEKWIGMASRGSSLAHRIEVLGETSPRDFRARQLLCSVTAAFSVAAIAGFGVLSNAEISPGSIPLISIVIGAMVFAGIDVKLSSKVRRYKSSVASEVPAVADLVCLGVVAGESLRSALSRAAHESRGVLGKEIATAIASATSSSSLMVDLSRMADRLRVMPLQRLVSSLALAHERGTPLAEQLQAITAEVRAEERRRLIEDAGKSQTRMLIPVVFLILPTALAFAFFPGFVALRAFIP